jgi:hypothetical protein
VEERRLFYMPKPDFDRVMNIVRSIKLLKRSHDFYRIKEFQIMFEFGVNLIISHSVRNYFKEIGFDEEFVRSFSDMMIIDKKRRTFVF